MVEPRIIYAKEAEYRLNHINEEYIEDYIRSILPESKPYLGIRMLCSRISYPHSRRKWHSY